MSIRKIAITGPESSGKTKLAEDIAVYFDALMVPEYARTYLEEHGTNYLEEEFIEMANGQIDQMEFYESLANGMVVFDTEILVYKIWGSVKYDKQFDMINRAWDKQDMSIYLLCKPDLEWEEDMLRESENSRDSLFLLYQSELKKMDRKFTIIDGKGSQRFEKAQIEIEALLIKQ